MKGITIFGTRFIHKPNVNRETIKLNGYEYTKDEVFTALQKKGYSFRYWTFHWKDETFPNGITMETATVICALKDGEEPSEQNAWYKVAEKEFKKTNYKPILE